jgi:hypothetical protein
MFSNETARVLLLWRSNETAGVATPRHFFIPAPRFPQLGFFIGESSAILWACLPVN